MSLKHLVSVKQLSPQEYKRITDMYRKQIQEIRAAISHQKRLENQQRE